MTKLDPRIARTRQALADSLIKLASERGFANLTIKMVTENAGVGNRTFYRHFLSLDDLLKHSLQIAFQELKLQALESETFHGEVQAFYTFIKNHQDLLRVYVSLPWAHPARQTVLTEAAKIVHARYSWQRKTSVPMGLTIEHILLATNHLVAWYLDHVKEYTPEQVAVIHDVLVFEALERQAVVLREDWLQTRQKLV